MRASVGVAEKERGVEEGGERGRERERERGGEREEGQRQRQTETERDRICPSVHLSVSPTFLLFFVFVEAERNGTGMTRSKGLKTLTKDWSGGNGVSNTEVSQFHIKSVSTVTSTLSTFQSICIIKNKAVFIKKFMVCLFD